MALELSRRHEVTLAAPAARPTLRDGIPIIPSERRRVVQAAYAADAVVAPRIPPYLYAALFASPTLLVADMYNPAEAERGQNRSGLTAQLTLAAIRTNDLLQLKFADIVLCAVEAQRRGFAARIEALAGRLPRRPLLRVVPFGIDNEAPRPSTSLPIRTRFKPIAADDTVVLWWGNVWRWFDAETALRAFAEVARENPKVKLVFTGGRPPRSEARELDDTNAARNLARSLGLLNKCVHFVDDWVPHSERQDYLQEADVGLTLHRDTPEREVAARGRYMDYLWARLPCVLGEGDELADRFAAAGFAATVRPGDVPATARALRRLIDDPEKRGVARGAAGPLLEAFRWSTAVAPLLDALEEIDGQDPVRAGARGSLLAALGHAYSRRLALEAVSAASTAFDAARRDRERSPA